MEKLIDIYDILQQIFLLLHHVLDNSVLSNPKKPVKSNYNKNPLKMVFVNAKADNNDNDVHSPLSKLIVQDHLSDYKNDSIAHFAKKKKLNLVFWKAIN